MTMNTVGPVPHPRFPLSGVTPFTYRDGWTYLEVLENFRSWIRDELVPVVNDNAEQMEAAYEAALLVFLEAVNDFNEFKGEQVANYDAFVAEQLQNYNELLGNLIGYTIEVTDTVYRAEMQDGAPFEAYTLSAIDGMAGKNVKRYGAVGDGVADDTAAIQAALDDGTFINIPSGMYRITEPLNVQSGSTVSMADDAVILSGKINAVFNVEGELGPEIRTSGEIGVADNNQPIVTTAHPHGLAVGDWVQIKSQRNSVSTDAGEQWRLGLPTGANPECPFTEYFRVASVESDTVFIGDAALTFPSYLPHVADEYHSTRSGTTIAKLNANENTTIRGGIIRSNANSGVRTKFAVNCRVIGTQFDWEDIGFVVNFIESVNCEARDCRAEYPKTEMAYEGSRHAFKVVSSQSCGFVSCHVENPSSGFEFTFENHAGPSFHGYVSNCTVRGATRFGAASHGGTYALQFLNNTFANVRGGIYVRARASIVSGNKLTGTRATDTSGIYVAEGWARDTVISSNVIHNFTRGMYLADSGGEEGRFTWWGITITGNIIHAGNAGIWIYRGANNMYDGESGITIANNHIQFTGPYARWNGGINVGDRINDVTISGNTINGLGQGVTAIRLEEEATGAQIVDNIFTNTTEGVNVIGSATVPVVIYPSGNRFIQLGNPDRRFVMQGGSKIHDAGFFDAEKTERITVPVGADATAIRAALIEYGLIE